MREHIQSAVHIFRANPDADDEEILKRIMESGIEERLAHQLLLLLPLAYGRVTLSDIVFPNTYLSTENPQRGRLDALPLWNEILQVAKEDREPTFPLASRSPEMKAVNEALSDGNFEDIVFGPPVFSWPIEPMAAAPGEAKPPGWLRQMWNQPAEHSMSHLQRTVARVVMVIAITIVFLTVGAVAYYGLSVMLTK